MKRGRDDEKVAGPMFPRLHVNDADKGGPRAPPRNKMALYEQLSIPSQRFSHSVVPGNPNSAAPNLSQGGDGESGLFFSRPHGHQIEKHYSPYSGTKIPLQQVRQRKKLDDDDYTVPTFMHHGPGKEFEKSSNRMNSGRFSSSNLANLNHPSKFKAKETEYSSQEGGNQSAENTKDFVGAKVKAVPGSNGIDETKAGSKSRAEVIDVSQPSGEGRNIAAVLNKASRLQSQNSFHDHIDDTASRGDGVCSSLQNDTLERGDSVSETSILDSVCGHDITADDIVAIIGQKHFWNARKAIVNQQRAFAVQVFELHRLIKVQKLIAASPHLLLDDPAYLGKALKSSPAKKLPLGYNNPPVKALPTIAKRDMEKTNHRKEASAENSTEKPSLSPAQNGPVPSSHRPLSFTNNIPTVAPSSTREPNASHWCVNQQQPHQGHQWLIPVMSPSEGLVYKPCPAPVGFLNQDCYNNGYGPPHMMGSSFPAPAYGIPAHQYQFPPYPQGFFHPYGTPAMNTTTTAFSGSSVDQVNPNGHVAAPPKEVANCSNIIRNNEGFQDSSNRPMDVEVQGSTESSSHGIGGERQRRNKRANSSSENRNLLTLFPAFPDSNRVEEEAKRPSRVIKVVPHNASTSVSESVARIIRSIEEERRQFDSSG